jgi:superfamily I DNA/RNA helicase
MRDQPAKTFWIKGFAGTGKTLVLTHLMEQLARDKTNTKSCYITYTNALTDLIKSAPLTNKSLYDIKTYHRFISDKIKYDFVFLDEVQDVKFADLKKIKQLAGKIYVAGDFNQQIYGDTLSEKDLIDFLNPEILELTEIFRLTAKSCLLAQHILPEARIVGENKFSKSLFCNPIDSTINIINANTIVNEYNWVYKRAKDGARPGDPSVILFPHHDLVIKFSEIIAKSLNLPFLPRPLSKYGGSSGKDYTEFNDFWKENDIPLMFLGSGSGSFTESDTKPLVYLITYYSVKGLDFKNVFIPSLTNTKPIIPKSRLKVNPMLERRLLFVATTRSRENLYISHSEDPIHPYLSDLPKNIATYSNIHESDIADKDDDDDDESGGFF